MSSDLYDQLATMRRERDAALAEAERLRTALVDAVEGMADMRPYVPDTFAEKWDHDGYLARGRMALGEP